MNRSARQTSVSDILDMKPKSMEELTEVITAATFHPSHCNVFLYSSSRGCIKMGDMRASALCDKHAKGQQYFFWCSGTGVISSEHSDSLAARRDEGNEEWRELTGTERCSGLRHRLFISCSHGYILCVGSE